MFGLIKLLPLVYVCIIHPSGKQDSLIPKIAWLRMSPGMGYKVFLKALLGFTVGI